MGITHDEKTNIFHLQTNNSSYILQVYDTGYIVHLYWGKKLHTISDNSTLITNPSDYNPVDDDLPIDIIPQEYPSYGSGDFRHPAYQIQLENGSTLCDARYRSYKIYKGKPKLEGLPATYVEDVSEATTLELTLADELIGLNIILYYTVFEELNAITRTVKFLNKGDQNLKLLRVLSMSVDFNYSDYDFLQLSGAWCRERHMYRRPLVPGIQSIDSRRGMSSHQQNPFIALLGKNTDEDHGEVYGFNLVYSGNFIAQAEVCQYFTTRISLGIHPFDFTWLLEPEESFQAPEVVMVYSDKGLGEMSRIYHRLYRTRLCRGNYRDKTRPILVNNWEGTYFDFDEEKILEIVDVAKELGIELFVLDDGWFGKRDSDNSSLGDWIVDRRKLPNGLDSLARRVNDRGLLFGLWFEPEMVSPDSDLYRRHPEWCIHVENRPRSQGRYQRNQLVLDLTRKDVRSEIIRMMSNILKTVPVSYVKWDMNRAITEMGSASLPPERQREVAHRYVLGLYELMDEITTAFPHVLFESCASGGGRFDPGILYYMPQTWTSDNTDAVERLKIQYGTSLIYPAITMGAHVSTSPNHQVGRATGLDIRGHVAMAGNFGYELDMTKLAEEEKKVVKKQVEMYKDIRHIVQFGDLYRVLNPFEGNESAWVYVTPDKKEAVATYCKVLAKPNELTKRLKLKGLNPELRYEVVGQDMVVMGDELMYIGLNIPQLGGDFTSVTWILKAINRH